MDRPPPSRRRSTLYRAAVKITKAAAARFRMNPNVRRPVRPSMIAATIWLVGPLVANVAGRDYRFTGRTCCGGCRAGVRLPVLKSFPDGSYLS